MPVGIAFRGMMSAPAGGGSSLYAWGYNYHGQLGDGTTVAKSSPVQVGTLTTWSTFAAGNGHTVALRK